MANPVQKEINKSVFFFVVLVAAALAVDGLLHWTKNLDIGRPLGPVGVGLVIVSFVYTLRRRKMLLKKGKLASYLRFHEFTAWLGSLLILIHSGIHFNAVIPWAATVAMLVATASGLTGKYLLKAAQIKLKEQKKDLSGKGHTKKEIDDLLVIQARAVDKMKNWRKVHFPITLSFAFLALVHGVAVFYYGWP